jgi:hypothetical protein
MVIGFSRWSVRSLYRSKSVAMECAKYILDWENKRLDGTKKQCISEGLYSSLWKRK